MQSIPGSEPRRHPSHAPLAVLVLSLAIVGLFGWLTWRGERATARATFDALALGTADAIDDRLEACVDMLVGGAALFSASEHVSAAEFRRYVGSLRLQERYPGIQGVGYSVRVTDAMLDSLVDAQRAAGFADFALHPDGSADDGERHAIVYLEPLDPNNRAAIGFDMSSQPVRRAAMERARDTGRPAASGTVMLVQNDEATQPSFLIYVPVYRGGTVPATVEARRRELVGFVYSPFRIGDLVSAAFDHSAVVDVRIYDDARLDPEHLLYASSVDAGARAADDSETSFRTTIELDVEGREWLAVISGGRALYDPFSAWLTRAAFGMGILVSLVFFLLTRSQAGSRRRAQQAAEALTRSEEQYRVLFEANPHPMWVYDIDTRAFLAVNDAAVAHYGYTRDEFLSMTLADIRPESDREALDQAIAGHSPNPLVWRHVRKDGETILVEVTAGAVATFDGRPGRLVLAHDITERVHAERELQQAQQRLRQILNLSNAVIYTMDVTGDDLETTWVTENLERVTGYTVEEGLKPGWWFHGLHPDDRDAVLATSDELVASGRRSLEYRFRRKDGTYIWVRDDAVMRRDVHGEPKELIGAWLDVSDRRRLEEQFQQAQKMEAVGRLAGGIAHDFNNILTIIRSQTDLLLMEMAPDPRAADLTVIQTAADRAAKLTSQLLAFSREQLLRPSVVDLADIVRGMGAMLSRIVGERMKIQYDLVEGLPPIEVDPGQLEQAILNLTVNARDAMPDGGVLSFATRVEEVDSLSSSWLEHVGPGRYVILSVADTGVGMSESVRSRIFDPFFTTKPKGKGTGLGLPMVYGFVNQSGGTLRATSVPGRGTTFDLYFPVTAKKVAPETGEAPRSLPDSRLAGTALLVEDEPNVARVSRRILERSGLRIREAADAETALRMLTDGEHIDLLVSDVGLPGMSGRQLIDELRRRNRAMPAVLISGYAEGAEDGAPDVPRDVEFVQKPFTPDALLSAVRRALERADG